MRNHELTKNLPIDASLARFHKIFLGLQTVPAEEFRGELEGLVVGPPWFQKVFGKMMAYGGLGGWKGKAFDAAGNGMNIVERGGSQKRVLPMYIVGEIPSRIDGRPTLALSYRKGPHARIVDEIRRLDERTFLGMSYYDLPMARRFPMPFALRKPG